MNRRSFLSSALTCAIASTLPTAAAAAPKAGGLRAIDKAYSLSAAQKSMLSRSGFAILGNHRYRSFTMAYGTIYSHDLPLFVTADSLLHALHRTFSDVLKHLEQSRYKVVLDEILSAMRADLSEGVLAGLSEATIADVDLYLGVALSLLRQEDVAPAATASADQIASLAGTARSLAGMLSVPLFGEPRLIDASQFTPRGHYNTPFLKGYFQAMIWLGRIDMRLLVPEQDRLVFKRRQLDAAVGLRLLMDQPTHDKWLALDRAIGAFIGPSDNLTPPQLDDLMGELSIQTPDDLVALSDGTIEAVITATDVGKQQILSHLLAGRDDGLMPRNFLLFGQRYTVDSHVLSAVVYDRLPVKRMMPSPLDVAYAALGNDRAKPLLADELKRYPYEDALEDIRALVEESGEWEDTLYSAWLGCIRALSVVPEAAPAVAKTEPWGRRVLSCQLASWAELRHDTILYVKQSYSGMAACEFPDVFVEPNPAFFDALGRYCTLALQVLDEVGFEQTGPFIRMQEAAGILGEMARHQERDEPFTDAQMDFINRAVATYRMGSGGDFGSEGWYPELFTSGVRSVEYDPVIADVHTQPTDAVGNPVGKVLHVASGSPRLMVVTVETCKGPRAYVGPVSAYREVITGDFERLNDQTWAQQERESVEVEWMEELVVG